MEHIHYVNKKGVVIRFITVFLMGTLWFIAGALCISYDYSEYVFGALFITILLIGFPLFYFFGTVDSVAISLETVRFINYSPFGYLNTVELKNNFSSELKKGSYRYFLKHENGKTVLLPRFVHKDNETYELFLLDNKVSVKRFAGY